MTKIAAINGRRRGGKQCVLISGCRRIEAEKNSIPNGYWINLEASLPSRCGNPSSLRDL